MADRPGSLAQLAARCGTEEVNILGLQIFPGIEAVTDELILSAPNGWTLADIAAMVEAAGGRDVAVSTCTAHALVDGPTNYLLAVRHVVEDPDSLGEALSELLDGETGLPAIGPVLATLEVPVKDTVVTVRRSAEFTVTEQARAHAFASVVADLLEKSRSDTVALPKVEGEPVFRLATPDDTMALVRMAGRCSSRTLAGRFGAPLAGLQPRMVRRLLSEGPALVVQVGHEVVGLATVGTGERAETALLVEDGWQRRGIGTRLLTLASRLAKARGAGELVLRSEHGGAALLRLSASGGFTGRVRQENGCVVLTLSLRRVVPLLGEVEGTVGLRPLDPAPA